MCQPKEDEAARQSDAPAKIDMAARRWDAPVVIDKVAWQRDLPAKIRMVVRIGCASQDRYGGATMG